MLELNKIYNQDCLKGLKQLDDDYIDLLLTDPPYGLLFMGKNWDKALPSIKIWKECLRVLKPGAFAFVMCVPRQDCLSRMIINLEDAGFDTEFTSIYWAYASGFPKAGNISKLVDKRLNVEREVIGQKKRGDVEEAKKRGTTFTRAKANRNNKAIFGYGTEDITIPATNQAKALDGSYAGFQPKPAVEVIIVAMKPLSEKTYVDQAMKNKKGITWLDNCKIPYKSDNDKESARFGAQTDIRGNAYGTNRPSEGHVFARNVLSSEQGRFPANLIVSDDILNDGKKWNSGGSITGNEPSQPATNVYGEYRWVAWQSHGDSGSFSRYFDLDAWWQERFKKLPEDVQKTFPFLIVPKASKSEKNKGCSELEEILPDTNDFKNLPSHRSNTINTSSGKPRKVLSNKNFHPTVKPIQLGSYLVTLGSRENDIVLDPFCGSGSFCISARMCSRKYIGFEIEKDYCKIAKARLHTIVNLSDWGL